MLPKSLPGFFLLLCFALGYLNYPTELLAQETTETTEADQPGVIGQATDYVDEAQRLASLRFVNFMSQVDGFFTDGSGSTDVVSNKSWARIRLDTKKPAGGKLDVGASLKLRVVLPETERRFRLLLSTEDDDTDIGGSTQDSLQLPASGESQDVSLALRFIRTARDTGSVNFDLGVRQRDGSVQYFGRVNNAFRGKLNEHWYASASNSYYYYSKSGFEDKLVFDFRRELPIQEDLYFRSSTEFNWLKGRKGAVIGQTIGIYSQVKPTISLALEGLASYYTALSGGLEDRYRGTELRARWRHNVWRPWFFYELWPSVAWPSINNYERSFGALVRFEFVIGQQ